MKRTGPITPSLAVLALVVMTLPVALKTAPLEKVDFTRDVQPLFAEHCLKCHGAEKQKGGLRLDLKTAALKGGDDGKVIDPGHAVDSKLIHLVEGRDPDKVMPAKGPRLTPDQIGILRRWIDEGAVWPDAGKPTR